MVNQENKQINKKDAPDRIKPVLNGAAETMLQSFYARAMYSKNPKHKFMKRQRKLWQSWIMTFPRHPRTIP